MADETVTLVSLRGGAAVELFDVELEKVLKNIADPNTDPKAVRKIRIDVILAPNQERTQMAVGIKATSTLAGAKPASTFVFLGRTRTGELQCVESNPEQLRLDVTPQKPVAMAPRPAVAEGETR